MIVLIAAVAENDTIGKNNELVWHLPDDFKRFKSLTSGHHIIMGRRTFESFVKPLPNRTHIIITRQKGYRADGCVVVDSVDKALQCCPIDDDTFVIGGGEIYSAMLPFADRLEITRVHHNFEGDARFPEIDPDEWKTTVRKFNDKDELHRYDFSYLTYDRSDLRHSDST